MLEYYEGILIMTTNRIKYMDLAFQSRIHLAVKFPELTTATRMQIWENFLQKLDGRDSAAREKLLERKRELAEWQVNGRQIRNVLTVAHSLCLSRRDSSRELTYEAIERVLEQTIGFQEYFHEDRKLPRAQLASMAVQETPRW
jgi:ATP-dependent 26S proteasome regulatory subunit